MCVFTRTYFELLPTRLLYDPIDDLYLEVDLDLQSLFNWVGKEELNKETKKYVLTKAQESNHLAITLDQALKTLLVTAKAFKLYSNSKVI